VCNLPGVGQDEMLPVPGDGPGHKVWPRASERGHHRLHLLPGLRRLQVHRVPRHRQGVIRSREPRGFTRGRRPERSPPARRGGRAADRASTGGVSRSRRCTPSRRRWYRPPCRPVRMAVEPGQISRCKPPWWLGTLSAVPLTCFLSMTAAKFRERRGETLGAGRFAVRAPQAVSTRTYSSSKAVFEKNPGRWRRV